MDVVSGTAIYFCAFAKCGVVLDFLSRGKFFVFILHSLPPIPSPFPLKVKLKHNDLMQGDWKSSLNRLNRWTGPQRPHKRSKRPTRLGCPIRPLDWIHKTLCSLIKLLRPKSMGYWFSRAIIVAVTIQLLDWPMPNFLCTCSVVWQYSMWGFRRPLLFTPLYSPIETMFFIFNISWYLSTLCFFFFFTPFTL